MTIGKIIALTIQICVSKVISLLFHMLSRFVIAFLPRSKHLLISWQSPSTVILEPKKIKSVTASTFSSAISLAKDIHLLIGWLLFLDLFSEQLGYVFGFFFFNVYHEFKFIFLKQICNYSIFNFLAFLFVFVSSGNLDSSQH